MESVMATLKLHFDNESYDVYVRKEEYCNGGTALVAQDAYDHSPFCTLSVWIDESAELPKAQCYLKTWSENEGFLEQLEEEGIVRDLGHRIVNNFGCEAVLVEILI